MSKNLVSFNGNMDHFSDDELQVVANAAIQKQIQSLRKSQLELRHNQTELRTELKETKAEQVQIKRDLDQKITLDYAQQQALLNAKNRRVEKLWNEGEIDTNLYDSKRKVHARAWRDLKDAFAVSSYKDIKSKQFDEARNYISSWRPRMV